MRGLELAARMMLFVLAVLGAAVGVKLGLDRDAERERESRTPAAIERRERAETAWRMDRVRDIRYFRRGRVCVGVGPSNGYGHHDMFAVSCDLLDPEVVVTVPEHEEVLDVSGDR